MGNPQLTTTQDDKRDISSKSQRRLYPCCKMNCRNSSLSNSISTCRKPKSSRSQSAKGVFAQPGIPAINSFVRGPVSTGNILATVRGHPSIPLDIESAEGHKFCRDHGLLLRSESPVFV